jgi:UDP-glucuronate 4-epimerase
MPNDKVLVTGAAGFIGFHVARQLLANGREVVGADSVNAYYDPKLKEARLEILKRDPKFSFVKHDLGDRAASSALFEQHRFPIVIHLAAQAGVRYSLQNPYAYVDANLDGFISVLEGCRHNGCRHLVFASSSSVYGANTKLPFSVRDNVDHPISLYAASKKANELMAHAYSHLFRIPATGLRFFTVYGPWGRPDMAPMIFARAIIAGEPIKVFNRGEMWRDFTYIDDIVDGVLRALDHPAAGTPPHRIYNLGNHKSEKLTDFIAAIEQALQRKAVIQLEPMQPGDVQSTYADIEASRRDLGFEPTTPISVGVPKFVDWYKQFYRV